MIEKILELKKPLRAVLTFLADVLLFNGHSRCCVDSEIYAMTSRSHWLR